MLMFAALKYKILLHRSRANRTLHVIAGEDSENEASTHSTLKRNTSTDSKDNLDEVTLLYSATQ